MHNTYSGVQMPETTLKNSLGKFKHIKIINVINQEFVTFWNVIFILFFRKIKN